MRLGTTKKLKLKMRVGIMATKVFKNYINGVWEKASSGEVFSNTNPANFNEELGRFQLSRKEDVDRAVSAAKEAQKMWRKTPAPKRGEIIFKVAEMLVKNKKPLAEDMTREMGKVLKETLGDVQEGIDTAYYGAGEGRRMFGETVPSELPAKFAMSVRMPVGVVAAVTPWNFPLAIPSWKLVPALICGNTVVLKPASDTPLSALRLVELFEKAGLPPGVLNLVTGTGSQTGVPLIDDPRVDLVSFTGSTDTGADISVRCARQMKQYSLEMGGKNAIVVLADADLELASEAVLWGAFGTTGQRCTACSRVIVEKKILKNFTNILLEKTRAMRCGDGLKPKTDVGPLVNEGQREKVSNYCEIGQREGGKLLTGGTPETGKACKNGYFFKPTLFAEVSPKMRIAQEEIFGPVLSIIACNNLDHAIEIVNDSDFGLSSAVFTADVNKAFEAIEDLDTGITYINSSTIGAEIQLPFGGTKGTGNGHREMGTAALDTYTEWKTVYVDYSGKLQKAQIDD